MGFWNVVILAAGVVGSLSGLWGLFKYRQAWRAGYQAAELKAAQREAARAKDRQNVEAAVRGRGDGVVGDLMRDWSRD